MKILYTFLLITLASIGFGQTTVTDTAGITVFRFDNLRADFNSNQLFKFTKNDNGFLGVYDKNIVVQVKFNPEYTLSSNQIYSITKGDECSKFNTKCYLKEIYGFPTLVDRELKQNGDKLDYINQYTIALEKGSINFTFGSTIPRDSKDVIELSDAFDEMIGLIMVQTKIYPNYYYYYKNNNATIIQNEKINPNNSVVYPQQTSNKLRLQSFKYWAKKKGNKIETQIMGSFPNRYDDEVSAKEKITNYLKEKDNGEYVLSFNYQLQDKDVKEFEIKTEQHK